MKKFIVALMAMMTITVSANAMSYAQAREQALFLTDKMAYELNLNDAQYEAAYEINLDYLMGINDYDDLYGVYWRRRNMDLSYILLDWQYRAYCAASYFYRPLYWDGGFWHFGIYARYPHRDYFYFGRPAFVAVYRGGHSWHSNGNRSWYRGRDFGGRRPDGPGRGMGLRDRFDRGDFGRGTREFGGRPSQPNRNMNVRGNEPNRSFGGRVNQPNNAAPRDNNSNRSFGGRVNQPNNMGTRGNSNGNRSFGGRVNQQPANVGTPSNQGSNRSFGNRNSSDLRSSTRTTVERRSSESSAPSFGGRSNNTPSRTFSPGSSNSPSRSSGSSFGGRSGGSSFGGGSRSGGSFGGGRSSGGSRPGGGSFGGGHR